MIYHYGLKEWLLKAVNLSKQEARKHLVLVQRSVNKPGVKTFFQHFWVRPDQVKSTDKVIAGHHNLVDGHPQKPTSNKIFSSAIKQQTTAFFSKFDSNQSAYTALENIGITWEKSESAGINLIRAKMALNAALQNGFVIPSDTLATDQLGDTKSTGDLVEVPSDATSAQRALADLINKMTNVDTIRKCAVMGVVPEDDVAEDFIVNTFYKKLEECVKYGKHQYASGDVSNISSEVSQKFYEDMVSMGFDFPDPSKRDKGNLELILEDVTSSSNQPISRSVKDAMRYMPFNMDILVNPHNYLYLQKSSQVDSNPAILIRQLNWSYPIAPSKDAYQDGFVQLLQRIKQENSHDAEVSAEVDRMVDTYAKLIELVDPYKSGKLASSDHRAAWNNLVSHFNDACDANRYQKLKSVDDPRAQVLSLMSQLFGAKITFTNQSKNSWEDEHIRANIEENPSRANKIVVSNLLMAAAFNKAADSVHRQSDFDFYVHDLDDPVTPEVKTKLTFQLNSVPLYSAQYIDHLHQYYQSTSPKKDNLKNMSLWREPESLASSPLKEVVYKNLSALLSYTPNPPKIDYNNFLNPPPSMAKELNLKDARQRLFQSAKLSLATESMSTSDKMRQDILTRRFDYAAGDTDVLGHSYHFSLYNGKEDGRQRFALFNSRFFKVNNSIWEERFNAEVERLKQQYPNHPEYSHIEQGFHGTSYWSAANILGRDGEFAIGQHVANGQMFGPGVYLGDRLGKSITYVGNDSYSMLSDNDLLDDGADGIIMLVDYVKGSATFQGEKGSGWKRDEIPEDASCVLAGPSNSSVKAAEIVIRNNQQVFPKYLVDVSGRSMRVGDVDEDEYDEDDFEGNIQQDDEGNFGYEDEDGNFEVYYTADGKSVKMK